MSTTLSPWSQAFLRGLSALPSFLPLAGFESLVDLTSSVLPSLAQRRGPSSRWVRPPPPLLAGGWPLSDLPPGSRWRGLLSPASRAPGPTRRVRGLPGSPTLRLAAVCLGGARCGLRPPVSPCRIRRCAVSRRGQLGPGVVSRRECVRLASARRGCRRSPTGGLPGCAPAVPCPPVPLVVVSGGKKVVALSVNSLPRGLTVAGVAPLSANLHADPRHPVPRAPCGRCSGSPDAEGFGFVPGKGEREEG